MLNLIVRTHKLTLESQIFDEKACTIKPGSFLDFWFPERSREECMEAAIAVIPRPSLLLSLFCLLTSHANVQSAKV